MTRHEPGARVLLNPNEIWLLLHALNRSDAPAIGWDGNPVEPWALGELEARLRDALSPVGIAASESRPAVALDTQMGQDLARAGIEPLVTAEAFDIGTMLDACARRGWGVELSLPLGSVPETPAHATVRIRDDESGEERSFVGLEEPAVALARALIGALVATRSAEATEPAPSMHGAGQIGDEHYEEYAISATAIGQGEKPRVIERMARSGWELVREEGSGTTARLVFRRPITPHPRPRRILRR